jgi:hypothetical protein
LLLYVGLLVVKLASGVCGLGIQAGSSHLEQETVDPIREAIRERETGDPIREAMRERERNQRFGSWSTEQRTGKLVKTATSSHYARF